MNKMHTHINPFSFKLIILIILLFAGTAHTAPNIALVGDSITSGYPEVWCGRGLQGQGGYAPYLEEILGDSGWLGNVLNYGIAGDGAQSALVEFSKNCSDETWAYSGQPIAHNQIAVALESSDPQYILYLMGTNDLPYHSASTVVGYIEAGINTMLNAGTIPIVGTILPDNRLKGDIKDIVGTNALLRDLLDEMHVQRAEFYDATSVQHWDRMTSDGLHPDSTGRQFMATIWYSAMLEHIENIENIENNQNKAKIAGAQAAVRLLLSGNKK